MENINKIEVNRRIGCLQYVLGKLENRMGEEQSERADIKSQLMHLRSLL